VLEEEGAQPPRQEALLERTPGAERPDVPAGPSTNTSDEGSRVHPGETEDGQLLDEGAGLDF
jgi:hypothetical protein